MRYNPSPLRGTEFTRGVRVRGTSTGSVVNFFPETRAIKKNTAAFTIPYKNTGMRIIVGVP